MSAIVPANFGEVSNRFANHATTDELSSGIQSSFGLIAYKGKVWSIRYRGAEQQLMRDDGDGPRGSIEIVVIKASSSVSKIWYENGYVEGSTAAPDCFSNNGVTPEIGVSKKQAEQCAVCPHNQWGSRITPAGKQGKACADSKRLAVVPLGDIANEAYGGPMLLRVPAASLQDVAMYGQKMGQLGYPYYAVATRIAFDPAESFPKFIFNAIRPLSDAEADLVIGMRDGHQVNRILSESEFGPAPAAAEQAAVASAFEQPPVTSAGNGIGDQARAVAAQQAAQHQPQQVAPAVQQVAQQQPVEDEATRKMREMEAELAKLRAAQQQVAQPTVQAVVEQPVQQVSGFGATAPVTTQVTQQVEQTTQPVVQQQAQQETAGGGVSSAFEEDLDGMLSQLLA